MSDTISAPESGASMSTADVATQVMESLDTGETSGDTSPETSTDTSSAESTPLPPPAQTELAPPPPVDLSPTEKFLQTKGHQARKVDGRETWLPYRSLPKLLEEYATERGQAWQSERTTFQQQLEAAKSAEQYLNEVRSSIQGDPAQFLAQLAEIDPRYRVYVQPQQQAPQQQQQSRMPEPDLPLPDGSRTYSLDGIQQLLAWHAQEVEGRLDARLKPVFDREQQTRQQAEQARVHQEIQARTSAQIEDARTWPGFKDHEGEILQALQADSAEAHAKGTRPALSLDAAYRKVVLPKLLADDAARRERLVKELQSAPRSTAVGRGGDMAAAPTSGVSTSAIAARVMDRLERNGR